MWCRPRYELEPLDFRTPLAKAQAAWRRQNENGLHHPCGCITRFDEAVWHSTTIRSCAFHAALGGGAR